MTSFRNTIKRADQILGIVRPAQVMSQWLTLPETNPAAADNEGSDILRPDLLDADRRIAVDGVGTALRLRLRYPHDGTITTDPVVQVFGRTPDSQGGGGAWQRLTSPAGDIDITLAEDAADTREGDFKHTLVAPAIDLDGCDEIVVAVKTALAGSGLTGAAIEGKII